nr:unnamed protein product [Digitaria exilis]
MPDDWGSLDGVVVVGSGTARAALKTRRTWTDESDGGRREGMGRPLPAPAPSGGSPSTHFPLRFVLASQLQMDRRYARLPHPSRGQSHGCG